MQYCIVSNKVSLCLLVVLAFAMQACEKRETTQVVHAEANAEYIEPAVEQFREPVDLRVDFKKAQYFSKASEALVVMGQEWVERMAQVDDEERLRMAAAYEKAQEDLIRKFGIKGKEEFKWIQTKALPDLANKEVFARAGVWIKQ